MSASVVEQQVDDPYVGRYLGRTRPQKAKEAEIRDSERDHIVAKLTRLGDGRQNKRASKEEREAFRTVAAMIDQHRGI